MKSVYLVAAAALFVSTSAMATMFAEVEPNDSLATAQVLVHDGTIELTGFRESSPTNDFNDFFRFDATAGDEITFTVDAIGGGDPVIRLLDSAGNILAENDDSGGTLNSLINFTILTTGNYFAAVRGFADSVYDYELTITGLTPSGDAVVPEPASWALMIAGFGLIGGAMRRRGTAIAA